MAPFSNQNTLGTTDGSQRFRQRVAQFAARNLHHSLSSSSDEDIPVTFQPSVRFPPRPIGSAAKSTQTSQTTQTSPPAPSKTEIQDFITKLNGMKEADFVNTTPENNPSFWEHASVRKVGDVIAIKKATDVLDGEEKIYLAKCINMRNEEGEKTGRSIIKFPAKELEPFVNEVLIPLYLRACKSAPYEMFGLDPVHDYHEPNFWEQSCVVKSPLGDVKVRPFYYNNMGRVNFRLWQERKPLVVENFEGRMVNWTGPQMSLSQVHFLGVIKSFMEILSGDGESNLHAIDISEKHRRASVV